jgi:23S rRNA pseudouridine2457 synthase
VLSQFTREAPHHRTLADLFAFPEDVYPVGRLDHDSEGLLLLTNDKRVNQQLLHPQRSHQKEYWVQVEGVPTDKALATLRKGVTIRIKKREYQTLPCRVEAFPEPPTLPERDPPIRYRKNVPDSWLSLQLTEGKNRQVRRMCAAVGFPVLRLVRYRIENLTIGNLQPGEVVELDKSLFQQQLCLSL